MKNLLETVGAKTGLTRSDVARVTRFGGRNLLGVIFVLFVSACGSRTPAPPPPVQEPPPEVPVSSPEMQAPSSSLPPDTTNSLWEGYPAGTRYATVSRLDFS